MWAELLWVPTFGGERLSDTEKSVGSNPIDPTIQEFVSGFLNSLAGYKTPPY